MTTGFGPLLRARLRRDRLRLPLWILGTALLALATVTAVAREYGAEADRAELLRLAASNPVLLVLRGTPQGAGLGALVYFQIGAFLGILAGLMSTFLVVRHTRAEEESGLAEAVAATPAGRSAPLLATTAHGVIANLVLSLAVGLALLAGGLEPLGSALAGLGVGAAGIAFVGVALVVAQIAPTARSANGTAAALVGLAYLVRGLGDANATIAADGVTATAAWPSALSPIGWAQAVHPFTDDDPLPLLGGLGVLVVGVAVALALLGRRDLGAGLLPARAGRAGASAALGGSLALTLRLQRGSILGWCAAAAVLGALLGTLTNTALSALEGNPGFAQALAGIAPTSRGERLDTLVAAIMSIVGITAAGCATQLIMRARQEEALGTVEALLATPLSRARWFGGYLICGAAVTVVVLLVAGAAAGATYLANGEDVATAVSAIEAALAQLPASLVLLAVTAVVFAVAPRLTIPLGWLVLTAALVLGQLGGLLGVPEWLRDLSPFVHTPGLPAPDVDWSGAVVMTGLAAALAAGALLLVRRRDLAG